ncbi:MAG: hypothetical protein WC807_12545 [Hyphomicrobium sp.]
MTLEEIAAALGRHDTPSVPNWALGTVRRRSITFATGIEDVETRVHWVQAHAMTGDLRIHPARPEMSAADRFEDMDLETLCLLASVEGGVARTSLGLGGLMMWSDWIGFQAYDKYPEPGLLRRIGDCMIEFAPSGAYIEDWRFLESGVGPLAGLRLVSETGTDGVTQARQGGLVIAGDHVIQSIARRRPLPEGTRAQDYVRRSSNPAKALADVFDCTVDYAQRVAGLYSIKSSTDPRRQGTTLAMTAGFAPAAEGHLIQHLDGEEIRDRLWRIDSLTASVEFPLTTELTPDARSWLEREADTLVHPLTRDRQTSRRSPSKHSSQGTGA